MMTKCPNCGSIEIVPELTLFGNLVTGRKPAPVILVDPSRKPMTLLLASTPIFVEGVGILNFIQRRQICFSKHTRKASLAKPLNKMQISPWMIKESG
jgi:hypothetical protein